MIRAVAVVLVLGAALVTGGCRGGVAERPADPGDSGGPGVEQQFDQMESTLSGIESDLAGD
jgi:hypothetical protein